MLHFVKYNIIGIFNTLITLVAVWVFHEFLCWNLELSNLLGFVAGACNSYFANRLWNFKSRNKKRAEILRFILVFICAYLVNLITLEAAAYAFKNIQHFKPIAEFFATWFSPSYLANIIANVVYVAVSFTLYKKIVYKSTDSKAPSTQNH